MARFSLPQHHQPAMAVPKGGSSCANCSLYTPGIGRFGACLSPHYHEFYGTALIPCPPDSFCSDWYQPSKPVRNCGY